MFEVCEADPMVSGIVASDPHGDGGWLLAGTGDSGVENRVDSLDAEGVSAAPAGTVSCGSINKGSGSNGRLVLSCGTSKDP